MVPFRLGIFYVKSTLKFSKINDFEFKLIYKIDSKILKIYNANKSFIKTYKIYTIRRYSWIY